MAGPTERPQRVLVVDDDPAIRLLAIEWLTEAGFIALEAENGRQALERATAGPVDLVLLDIGLPDLSGFDVCRALRDHAETREVPVLIMTGLDDPESIHRAYEAGATDFTTKPMNWLVLAHRVRYMIRASASRRALAESEARLIEAQRVARLGWWEAQIETGEISTSALLPDTLGLGEGADLRTIADLLGHVHPEDRAMVSRQVVVARRRAGRTETEFRTRYGGDNRFFQQTVQSERDPRGPSRRVLATIQDVTERKNHEREIHYLAHYDALTGLPNRRMLERHLARTLESAEKNGATVGVLFVDLDNFTDVNDSFGHPAGDRVLKEVAERLLRSIRQTDLLSRLEAPHPPSKPVVGRIGGDEYVVVLNRIRRPEDAALVARRVVELVREPLEIDGREVVVTASVGIAVSPADTTEASSLLSHADAALYHAKRLGRDGYQFYTRELNDQAKRRLLLETSLRKAIEKEEWEVYYQPIIEAATGKVTAAEALVRWKHPDEGLLLPAAFIPVAEDTGMIIELGRWVLRRACADCALWQERGAGGVGVSVNLSPRQFGLDDTLDEVRDTIIRTDLDPDLLTIEVTETSVMDKVAESIERLEVLRRIGIWISIDDFGVGYSSLSQLRRLPVTDLKVDQSFVSNLPDHVEDVAITSAIVALAQSFGLSVVAEGVETAEQRAFLGTLGCDKLQGFHIARPMPLDKFLIFMARSRAQAS